MADLARLIMPQVSLLLVPLSAVAREAPPQSPVRAGAVGAAILPQDLSAWGMFAHADWVVKAVIVSLALASVLTWTVALVKALELLVVCGI